MIQNDSLVKFGSIGYGNGTADQKKYAAATPKDIAHRIHDGEELSTAQKAYLEQLRLTQEQILNGAEHRTSIKSIARYISAQAASQQA